MICELMFYMCELRPCVSLAWLASSHASGALADLIFAIFASAACVHGIQDIGSISIALRANIAVTVYVLAHRTRLHPLWWGTKFRRATTYKHAVDAL